MAREVFFYRVRCFRRAEGPWRADRDQARQDAIALNLGCFDDWGQYYDIMPGNIEVRSVKTPSARAA